MNKEQLEIIIREQMEEIKTEKEFVFREMDSRFLKTKKIVAISGVRRSGKSTLLRQISKNLSGFYYLNFEDERLLNFSVDDFNVALEIFQTLYGEQKTCLFDEIQEIVGWEKFVSRLQRLDYKVFVTGSNAKLLSSELSTYLTGRHLVFKMYPFSFSEFLLFKNFTVKQIYTTKEKAVLMRHFKQFKGLGGFPEIVESADKSELDQIYQDILIKDLLIRFKIRETKSFRELAFFYLSNIGTKVSFNNLKKILKIASVSSVKNYTEYLESSYLYFLISKFDYSLKKQIVNDKKVYCIDTGIAYNLSFRCSSNSGRYLENIVFLELKRRSKDIFYFSEKGECDFVIRKGRKIVEAIQVTEHLDEYNKEREVDGLVEALEKFNLKSGLILTNDEEGQFQKNGKKIKVMPVWKWLLL